MQLAVAAIAVGAPDMHMRSGMKSRGLTTGLSHDGSMDDGRVATLMLPIFAGMELSLSLQDDEIHLG